jgi:hypothetical protein
MKKNTTKDIHDKHIKQIRNGSLPLWKEDVEQDSSVTEFTHSGMSAEYSPVYSSSSLLCKSRTSKEPLEPSESKVGSQSTSGMSEDQLKRQAGSQSA